MIFCEIVGNKNINQDNLLVLFKNSFAVAKMTENIKKTHTATGVWLKNKTSVVKPRILQYSISSKSNTNTSFLYQVLTPHSANTAALLVKLIDLESDKSG